MFPEAKNDYGFGTSYYSTIMAFRADAKPPKNWTDFFDTVNFPGKRALPYYPDYVLPFADLADGIIPAAMIRRVMDACWNVESLPNAAEIAKMSVSA